MHLIPLHIGDFSQATERFKPVHMGLYLRLLMEYYKSEKGLPDSQDELEWVSGAESKADKDALQMVLRRCFVHFPDQNVYRQKRADREIESYRLAGIQKRHAILCRHWESVNPGAKKPSLEEFTAEPNRYYDEATGRIRKVYDRKQLVLQSPDAGDTSLPLPNYVPVTSNQEPETSNLSTPIVPEGTRHRKLPNQESLAEAIYLIYPRKEGKKDAIQKILKALKESGLTELEMQNRVKAYKAATDQWPKDQRRYIPLPATWFHKGRYMDDPAMWERADDVNQRPGFGGQKKEKGAGSPESKKPAPEPDWDWLEVAGEMGLTITCRWLELPASTRFEIRQARDKKNKEGGAA